MALATAVPTQTKGWWDGQAFHSVGTIAIGASPLTYQAGGIVLDWTVAPIKSSRPPIWADIKGISGFKYEFSTGTAINNGLLLIRVEATVGTNTPLAEHSTAAIVAGVSSDTVTYHAIFPLR